jgi:hypothetical protein
MRHKEKPDNFSEGFSCTIDLFADTGGLSLGIPVEFMPFAHGQKVLLEMIPKFALVEM